MYQGDAKKSVNYFSMINRPVPRFCNPADFFMKILSINYPKQQADEEKLEYLNRNYHAILSKSVRAENKIIRLDSLKKAEDVDYMAPVKVQMKQLMYRSMNLVKNQPRLSRAKIMQTVVVSLIMIPVFWQINKFATVEADIDNMTGAIYFITLLQMFLNFQATVVVFQQEKPVYVRERDAGMYDIWVYATTKLIAEQPVILSIPLVMNILVYFAIGFTDKFSNFMAFYLVLMMMIQVATSLGYMLSSFFNQESAAAAFAPALNVPINLLAGYMINLKYIWQQTPQRYIAWLMFFSPMRYGFNGMMLKQFPVTDQGEDVERDTQAKLNELGIDKYSYWGSVASLLILFIFFRAMVVFILWVQDVQKRGQVKGDTRNTDFSFLNRESFQQPQQQREINSSFRESRDHQQETPQ